jgi:transposase
MISGVFFVLRTGVPWRDLPREFGPWNSVYTQFRRWCRSGLWSKLLAIVSADACGSIRSVDCTHIKVHQDASNAAGGTGTQAIGRT